MQRYESGERELNREEKAYEESLVSAGTAFQPLAFDLFLENMKRYESGERELNREEKAYEESLVSAGTAYQHQPLAFDLFLENMKRYQNEKTVGRHR